MEKIISNPGLQHLAEKVFLNLDVDVLKICGQINKSCKQILKQPMFWLRKFGCLSKESQKGWVNIIQSVAPSMLQSSKYIFRKHGIDIKIKFLAVEHLVLS